MSEDISKLNDNPMFRLSLGAKELFHSNFLGFLLEQSEQEQPGLQKALLRLFGVDVDNLKLKNYKVETFRERNKFDLIVWVKPKDWNKEEELLSQSHLIFIENKFKSVPTKEQLISYNQKICEAIKNLKTYDEDAADDESSGDQKKDYDIIKRFSYKRKTNGIEPYPNEEGKNGVKENPQIHKYLLGVKEPYWFKDENWQKEGNELYKQAHNNKSLDKYANIKWGFTSYKDILETLNKHKSDKVEESNFVSEMISKYTSFTSSILGKFEDWFKTYLKAKRDEDKGNQKYFYIGDNDKKTLHSLRIKDLFEKYNISLLRNYLEEKLGKDTLGFEEGFSHGTGVLSVWRQNDAVIEDEKMKNKGGKGVQIQGNSLRKFIQLPTKNNKKEDAITLFCAAWCKKQEDVAKILKSYSGQFFYTEEKLLNNNNITTYQEIRKKILDLLPEDLPENVKASLKINKNNK